MVTPQDAQNKIFTDLMWVSGQLQNPLGIELVGSAIEYYGVEGIIDNSIEGEYDSRPILESLSISLTDQCKSQLVSQVPSSWSSENYGVEHFLKAVEIIMQNALNIWDLRPEQQQQRNFILSSVHLHLIIHFKNRVITF